MAISVRWLDQLRLSDLAQVGGKNASWGEMIGNLAALGVSVPGGFATTADAFRDFCVRTIWRSASPAAPGGTGYRRCFCADQGRC